MMHALTLGQQWMRDFWFPEANSVQSGDTDALFLFILWVSIFAFVVLMVLMVFFVVKYRRREGVPPERSPSHNTPLELAWSIIPLLVMVVIFFWGFKGYMNKVVAPGGAEEIRITGRRWNWSATYSNGATPRDFVRISNEESPVIVVPAGRPVKLIMTSEDVIHSFYIPAFRIKFDVFPNRFTSMVFEALEPGEHWVFCAEYCGEKHSEMAALIRVVPADDFDAQKNELLSPPDDWGPVEVGQFLYRKYGCSACHTIDGGTSTGPTWHNMWGYEQVMSDGERVMVDHDYIQESVYDPQARIHQGYEGVRMNSYRGIVTLDELDALIMFMRSISDRGGLDEQEPGLDQIEGEQAPSGEMHRPEAQGASGAGQPEPDGGD